MKPHPMPSRRSNLNSRCAPGSSCIPGSPWHSLRTLMIVSIIAWGLIASGGLAAQADVEVVAVRVDQQQAWVGQRVSFFVELRSPGPFAGAASFDLPELPGVMVLKTGNPVVGSEQLEGDSWLLQTHEFSMFSQRSGTLTIPEFHVRFAARKDFTGPAIDVKATCPSFQIHIQRPPGSESIGFLVTSPKLEITESWTPNAAQAQVGAIFKRTITQRAEQLPGMALAPASNQAPEGVRVYVGDASTNDQLERGAFVGERRETITYLLQQPGTVVLPELTYIWWNSISSTLETQSLPAVIIEVSPPIQLETATTQDRQSNWLWPGLIAVMSALAIAAVALRRPAALPDWIRRVHTKLNSPATVAARKLLKACRANDAAAANQAWLLWISLQDSGFRPDADLTAAVIALQQCVFGTHPGIKWNGRELAASFQRHQCLTDKHRRVSTHTALPLMNP